MPVLPREIWLYVFALASYIPGAFDTRCPNAITAFTRDLYGICVHESLKRVELKTDAEIIEALAEAVPSVQVLWLGLAGGRIPLSSNVP